MTCIRLSARHGFALWTMIWVLMILGIFWLVANDLFVGAIRIAAKAQETQTHSLQIDAMLRQLERDCWSARQVRQLEKNSIELVDSAGNAIRWQVGLADRITRLAPADHIDARRAWNFSKMSMSLKAHPAGLRIDVEEAQSSKPQMIFMPAPLLQTQGGAP